MCLTDKPDRVMKVHTIESKVHAFCKELMQYELFKGSGFSVFGELFKEYISLSIYREKVKINLDLCEKVECHLNDFETKYVMEDLLKSKEFLQLLCFYLSYRNFFEFYRYRSRFTEQYLELDTYTYLEEMGCGIGTPGSGNFAMFYAILIYNETRDAHDVRIQNWFKYMDSKINRDGFWGKRHITYSLQNGYHQHEIYHFFQKKPAVSINVHRILASQDNNGHFGPFPGGGGCYDYDTVDLLYRIDNPDVNESIDRALLKLYNCLKSEQQLDGGFCESIHLVTFKTSILSIVLYTFVNLNLPRLKFMIKTLISRGNNFTLPTHWSVYDRKFNESDTWNSWFRLLTIYKIESRLYGYEDKSKIFPFPGIAYR